MIQNLHSILQLMFNGKKEGKGKKKLICDNISLTKPWQAHDGFLTCFKEVLDKLQWVGNFNNHAQYCGFESNETSCETMQICFNQL